MKYVFIFLLCLLSNLQQQGLTAEESDLNEYVQLSLIEISIDTQECQKLHGIASTMFHKNFDHETVSSILLALSQDRCDVLTPEVISYLKIQRKYGTILRDAFDLFDNTHTPPPKFEEFLDAFGDLNDLIAAKLHEEILKKSTLILQTYDLSLLIKSPADFGPADSVSFYGYLTGLIAILKELSSQEQLSAGKFHEMRWTMKKFLNLFHLLSLADLNVDYLEIEDYLDNLNNQMGNIHDAIVMADLNDKQTYETQLVTVPLIVKTGIRGFFNVLFFNYRRIHSYSS